LPCERGVWRVRGEFARVSFAVPVPFAVSFSFAFSLPIAFPLTLISLPLPLAVAVALPVVARRWGAGLAECAHGGIHG
jgi:hypothetical protein